MIIMTLITIVLAVPAFWLTLRYNMHMFQLNAYKKGEQTDWLRDNIHMQWILVFSMAFGILSILLTSMGSDVLNIICTLVTWLTLAIIIAVYSFRIDWRIEYFFCREAIDFVQTAAALFSGNDIQA